MTDTPGGGASAVDVGRVSSFLAHEARLMDGHRYDDWLSLWGAGDIRYWVPVEPDDDPACAVAIVHDDRTRLVQRVARLKSRHAHAHIPAAKLCRVLGPIEIVGRGDDHVEATSTFILQTVRNGVVDTLSGRVHHVLDDDGSVLRLTRKTVHLLQSAEPLPNLPFLL